MKSFLECLRENLPEFCPRENVFYEFSYMFETLKDGEVVHGFSQLVAPWKGHESRFAQLQSDKNVLSCLVEYRHEYDCSFVAHVFALKKKEDK